MIGGGQGEQGVFLPAVAPVMILVGSLMMKTIASIPWSEPSDAIPAFLVIVGIPFSYNIAYGIGFGFVTYPVLKLASGKGRDVHWLNYILAAVFLVYFAFFRH